MTQQLLWLPGVLRKAGLKVSPEPGWVDRSYRPMGRVLGVMCHHTATANAENRNMPTLGYLKRGDAKLRGPIAQLGLGRDGTFYVIAAGRANHAGEGSWPGIALNDGNAHFIGIEAEHDGKPTSRWPDVQMDAYRRGVAALLDHLRAPTSMCIGHKEYAPRRKSDPAFDMNLFRAEVDAIRNGQGNTRPLIPAMDPEGRPTLRRGMRGQHVEAMQQQLRKTFPDLVIDAVFGPVTEARVRSFQRQKELVPDGIVGPKTWAALAAADPIPQPPPGPPG